MKGFLRILLLGVIVVLGFTAVFPEWLDLKDQLIAEKRQEELSKDQARQDELARVSHREVEARLRTLEPEAAGLAEHIWNEVEAGNHQAPFQQATSRLRSQITQEDPSRIRDTYHALGQMLSTDAAQAKPGYSAQNLPYVYLQGGMNTLVVESNRWSENAMLKRTLEFKLEDDALKVDAVVFEVFLYPDAATSLPDEFRRPYAFR